MKTENVIKVNEYLIQFELLIPGCRGTIYTDYISFQDVGKSTAKDIFDRVVKMLADKWTATLNVQQINVNDFKINIFSLVNTYETIL